jgi:hypothetical protein
MKHIVFVWIPIVLVFLFVLLGAFVEIPMPYEGAIFLLGCSISGYTGLKSFGLFIANKELPKNDELAPETKEKFAKIIIALYIIILESMIVQYIKPDVILPLNDLLVMAGICSAVVLGGSQAIKTSKGMGK